MSNEPSTLWGRWQKSALTWLVYVVVVVMAVAIFDSFIALTIAKIAFVIILLGSYVHRKLQLTIEADDSEPLHAEHPGAPPNSD